MFFAIHRQFENVWSSVVPSHIKLIAWSFHFPGIYFSIEYLLPMANWLHEKLAIWIDNCTFSGIDLPSENQSRG